MSSDSHKSQNSQRMLDHLMQFATSPKPAKAYSLALAITRKNKCDETPPTAQAPVAMIIHSIISHDLVAISMGLGGWVFKISSTQNTQA